MIHRMNLAALFFMAVLLLTGCTNKEKTDFSKYITGYTSGVIKSSSSLSVYLGQPSDKGFQAGSTLPADLFRISPAIKGELILKDNHSIEFIPAERFKNGTTYKVTFNLGALCNVPKPYEKFNFEFDIVPLVTIFEPGVLISEPDHENELQYQGMLQSSDETDPTEMEQKLTATYNGQSVTPEWNHQGNRHYFAIRHLLKEKESKTLNLKFSKDIKATDGTEISIPGLNDFTVLNVKASDSEPPVIRIYMSENIDPNQDLKGLFSLEGASTLNYKISDNIIYLYPGNAIENSQPNLTIHAGIRSANGNTLHTEYIRSVRLSSTKPQVQLIGKGIIVPGNNQVLIPFSAIGLQAVDLEIIQVLDQNMNFFLQENSYDDRSELTRTARPVFMKKIDLKKDHPHIDLDKWNDFTIDLSDLVNLEKGSAKTFQSQQNIPFFPVPMKVPTRIMGIRTGTTRVPTTANIIIHPVSTGNSAKILVISPTTPVIGLQPAISSILHWELWPNKEPTISMSYAFPISVPLKRFRTATSVFTIIRIKRSIRQGPIKKDSRI